MSITLLFGECQLKNERGKMKSRYVPPDEMDCVLMCLTPANRLVCRVCLHTGLRVGDVLALTPAQVAAECFVVTEQKTGKKKRVRLPAALRAELAAQSGAHWVFEGRSDPQKHRTRQAVWADMVHAARALRIKPQATPHSTRKDYAVRKYHACGNMDTVRKALNHDNALVTMLYALADQLPLDKPSRCRKSVKGA